MPRHILATPTLSERTPLVSATWYTPSATQGCLVTVKVSATGISTSEDSDFSISLRDAADAVVAGYPVRLALILGVAAVGAHDVYSAMTFYVPPGYDYSVTDNSTGATATTMAANEALM